MGTRARKYRMNRMKIGATNFLFKLIKVFGILAVISIVMLAVLYKVGEKSLETKRLNVISQHIEDNAIDMVYKETENKSDYLVFTDMNNIEVLPLEDFYEKGETYFLFVYNSSNKVSNDFYKTLDTAIKEADISIYGIDLSEYSKREVSKFLKVTDTDNVNPYMLKVAEGKVVKRTQDVRYDELVDWLNYFKFNK